MSTKGIASIRAGRAAAQQQNPGAGAEPDAVAAELTSASALQATPAASAEDGGGRTVGSIPATGAIQQQASVSPSAEAGWEDFRDTFKRRVWAWNPSGPIEIKDVLELLNTHHRAEFSTIPDGDA